MTARVTTVNAFLCPSDGNVPTQASALGQLDGAGTNYPNNMGTDIRLSNYILSGPTWFLGNAAESTCAGAAISSPLNGVKSTASITDGTSNTVSFSEFVKGKGVLAGRRPPHGLQRNAPEQLVRLRRQDPDRRLTHSISIARPRRTPSSTSTRAASG